MTDIQIKYWQHKEGQRHNLATEAYDAASLEETKRHNVVAESLTSFANTSGRIQANAAARNAATQERRAEAQNELDRARVLETHASANLTNARTPGVRADSSVSTQTVKERVSQQKANTWQDKAAAYVAQGSAEADQTRRKLGVVGDVIGMVSNMFSTVSNVKKILN